MFVEQIKEILYPNWNMVLLTDLILTSGKYFIFHNIFGCVYLHPCMSQINLNFLFKDKFKVYVICARAQM